MKNTPSNDIFSKVNMYLDKELSAEDEQNFLKEVEHTPGYNDILSKERSFKEFIKNKTPRRHVSPDLIQKIKDKIRVNPPF